MQCSHTDIEPIDWGERLPRVISEVSKRKKKNHKTNGAETGEYVLLGRKSRGCWTVSRGTKIARAETEEGAVKSDLGWSRLPWTGWREHQRASIRIHMWSAPKVCCFFTLTPQMDSCSIHQYTENFSARHPRMTTGLLLPHQMEANFSDASANQRGCELSLLTAPGSPFSITLT